MNPQHWHIAKRAQSDASETEIYMEVLRKETTLSDVDNVALGLVRKFLVSNEPESPVHET